MIVEERKGPWMQGYSGRSLWPLDLREEDICPFEIAHSISMQCRYGGHCIRFLSVAEHCCLMSDVAPKGVKLTALMHDAGETYLSDVPKPLKPSLLNYYDIERSIDRPIARKYGLVWDEHEGWSPIVQELDVRILLDERNQNMGPSPRPPGDGWPDHVEPLGVTLQYWTPEEAEKEWLDRFYYLWRKPNSLLR